MGLYITRTILSELGGQIEVTNHAEGGACFSIRIPEGVGKESTKR